VGPRAGLNEVTKRILCPCRESKSGRAARSLVPVVTELPRILASLLNYVKITECYANVTERRLCPGYRAPFLWKEIALDNRHRWSPVRQQCRGPFTIATLFWALPTV
jgi:hypothetical protein